MLIAHAAQKPWAQLLGGSLADWPVQIHWSHSGDEAMGLLSDRQMHLGVVDVEMPMGGLELVRRVRRMGLVFPCLLVAEDPDPRLLQDALALDVFGVVQEQACEETLFPAVMRLLRKIEGPYGTSPESVN